MWRHPTYPDTATGAVNTRSAVKFQAVMRVGALSGVGRKSCLGGEDAKVRKRDQIDTPHISAHDGRNPLGCLLPKGLSAPPTGWAKPEGYPLNQNHNDNKRPLLKAGGGSGPPNTDRVGKRASSGALPLKWADTERKAMPSPTRHDDGASR